MASETTPWTYNEFLAFLMVFGAEMNYPLTREELDYIHDKTQIESIDRIKSKVDSLTDVEGLDVIEQYRTKYLSTEQARAKVKSDLEALLQTGGKHSQLEKVAVHLIEKLI